MSYLKFKKPTPEQFKSIPNEAQRYSHLVAPYCAGCGVDIASQGATVVPWAISFDLPEREFLRYSNGNPPKGPVHLRGDARRLPFETASLDFVFSSHLLEDFDDRLVPLAEWCRCVRIGGHIIILVPDRNLWKQALDRGQPPNCSHFREFAVGELTEIFSSKFGHFETLKDELTAITPEDYTIQYVAKRVR